MRRFEFRDGTSNKFWEVELDGESFTVRYGRMGTAGQNNTKVFPTAEKARTEADKAIRSKIKKGYAEVEQVLREVEGNPELEAALFRDPEDRAAWQVYADWLQGEGDPRGDLVAVHLGLAVCPDDEALLKKAEKLLATNRKLWFGELDPEKLEGCFQAEWRFGYWRRVKIGLDWKHEDLEFTKLLGQVLRHPSAAFLEVLELGLADNQGENFYADAVASLVKHGKRPSIRKLHIGAYEYPDAEAISWSEVGNVSKIFRVLPNLEDLQLTGAGIDVGRLDSKVLRRLMLETFGLPKGAAASVARADLPELEDLQVWFGTDDYGGDCDVGHAAAILANTKGLPKVKKLGLKNADFQDAICEAVVQGPLLAQLEELDLSMGTMTAEGAKVLLDNVEKLKHLRVLNIERNFVDETTVAALEAVFPNLLAGEQDADMEYIYVSVGE